jgi:hypothetical protein
MSRGGPSPGERRCDLAASSGLSLDFSLHSLLSFNVLVDSF